MSSSIYEEALADVKKLKEVAEQNAKNAIIDAVTPKIREMIEQQLIGDASTEDGDVLSGLAESLLDNDADDVQLTAESLRALSGLVNNTSEFSVKDAELNSLLVQERLLVIMDSTVDEAPNVDSLAEMKEEIVTTYGRLVENRSAVSDVDFNRIQRRLASLDHFLNEAIGEKEMNERDLRSILDEEALRLVLDLGDDVDVDPDVVAVSVEPAEVEEEEVTDVEEDGDDVETAEVEEEVFEAVTPGIEAREAGEAEIASTRGGGAGVIGSDAATLGESDVTDDEVLEINEEQLASMIRSILSEDDTDEGALAGAPVEEWGEGDDHDADERARAGDEPAAGDDAGPADEDADEDVVLVDEGLGDDTVVEISESMLRAELGRMRRLRESPAPTTTSNNDNKVTSNGVDQLKTQLQEYKKAVSSLRGQLDESNLFNAKLLYANKLLQGRHLSDRQRVNIVESLDNAKSLREVRLLYKTLIESVDANKGALSESKRRRAAGSASRPTRTGSVSKSNDEYPETDRWAILAGINK